MVRIAAFSCFICLVTLVGSGFASGDMYFGKGERIKCLQPLSPEQVEIGDTGLFRPVVPKPSDPTMLCYKYTIQYFILGIGIRDDGYVLSSGDDYYNYFPLDDAKIHELQTKGVLPDPLPAYSLTWMQLAAGYSLWVLIGAVVLAMLGWAALKMLFGKVRRIRNKGIYCLGCNAQLTIKDFSDGKCEACSEPVPSM
jgi:hypothetical protein